MISLSTTINNHTLEYIDESHTYIVDGIIIPSITQILKVKFGGMYQGIPHKTLQRAANYGTSVHKAIEDYCTDGIDTEIQELYNFKFLQKHYGFEVLQNEVPVILFRGGTPIAAGRLDLVLELDGEIGGADIKTTSVLNKEYLAYQLNLYRIAYRQSYDIEWKFLKGIHLKGDKRKFVDIPINEELTLELLDNWRKENE